MNVSQLLALLKSVLLTPEVIGVTIVIALYVNIVNYIVRYRKQPPKPTKKRARAAAKAAPAEPAEESVVEDDEDTIPAPRKRK